MKKAMVIILDDEDFDKLCLHAIVDEAKVRPQKTRIVCGDLIKASPKPCEKIDEKEKWAKIKDYPDYVISTFGNAKRLSTNRTLKVGLNKHGYRICLYSEETQKYASKQVASLVINTFKGETVGSGRKVYHKDGIRKNNRLSNLSLEPPSKEPVATPVDKAAKIAITRNRMSNKQVSAVKVLMNTTQMSDKKIAKLFNVSDTVVDKIRTGATYASL